MPRLSDDSYLRQRNLLVEEWQRGGHNLTLLSPSEQWDLHGCFAPAETFSDVEALKQRRDVSVQNMSLPQRAGRAYVQFQRKATERVERLASQPPHQAVKRIGHKRHYEVTSHVLVKPQPDFSLLARALLELVRLDKARERPDDKAA